AWRSPGSIPHLFRWRRRIGRTGPTSLSAYRVWSCALQGWAVGVFSSASTTGNGLLSCRPYGRGDKPIDGLPKAGPATRPATAAWRCRSNGRVSADQRLPPGAKGGEQTLQEAALP